MKKNVQTSQGARPRVIAIIVLPLVVLFVLLVAMSIKRTPKTAGLAMQVPVQVQAVAQRSTSEQPVGTILESHANVQFDNSK